MPNSTPLQYTVFQQIGYRRDLIALLFCAQLSQHKLQITAVGGYDVISLVAFVPAPPDCLPVYCNHMTACLLFRQCRKLPLYVLKPDLKAFCNRLRIDAAESMSVR